MKKKVLKVVLMGAASPQWCYTIMRDVIVVLSGDSGCSKRHPVLVLEDVDAANLDKARRLAEMIADKTGNKVRIASTTSQREALKNADFVITSLAVGTLEAMQCDLEIPYEYGIYQPVGDTISIGGAIRAARNIPVFVEIARNMERYSSPGAWLLNVSNPMSTIVRAVSRVSKVNVVGLCHELYGGMGLLSKWLGFAWDDWRAGRVKTGVVGINHCAWLQEFTIDGKDGFARLGKFLKSKGITERSKRLYNSKTPELRHENVKMILFLRHGVFPYSGDRHNVEFFPDFVSRKTNLGADYGVMLTTIQSRIVDWRGNARVMMDDLLARRKEIDLSVSREAFSKIIKAIVADEEFYDVCNMPYYGRNLPGVPRGAVIERMCSYDADGAHPVEVSPLPKPLQEHLALHARIIEDVVEASLTGNRALMIAALERDPLLRNMDRNKIPELWDRLAAKNRRFLHPAFFELGKVKM